TFVIVGPPGSGKTTLLKHIVLSLLTAKKLKGFFSRPRLVPLFLFLRDYQDKVKSVEGFSLADAVYNHLTRISKPSLFIWLEQHLKEGNCLILLDGLDEVADKETRRQVSQWIEEQIACYPRNCFIVTSRPYGYQEENRLSAVTLEIQPFNSKQITQYI